MLFQPVELFTSFVFLMLLLLLLSLDLNRDSGLNKVIEVVLGRGNAAFAPRVFVILRTKNGQLYQLEQTDFVS